MIATSARIATCARGTDPGVAACSLLSRHGVGRNENAAKCYGGGNNGYRLAEHDLSLQREYLGIENDLGYRQEDNNLAAVMVARSRDQVSGRLANP